MTAYLSLEDALVQVKYLGFHIKDLGLLDSALARPQTTLFGADAYQTLELKAAAMMHSFIKNHPLVDGNKRTSWMLFVSFLVINGYEHDFSVDEGFEFTLGMATDQYSLDEAAEIIKSHLIKISWSKEL